MLKKIVSLFCSTVMMFSLFAVSAQAKENEITLDTIVTEENMSDVLEYLEVDNNDCILSGGDLDIVVTVKELKEAIDKLKSLPEKIEITSDTTTPNEIEKNGIGTFALSGTMNLYRTTEFDSYNLEFGVTATHNYVVWTGASGGSVSVDDTDGNILTSYKVNVNYTNVGYSQDVITMQSSVVVSGYLSVGDYSLIKISESTVDSTIYWYSKDYFEQVHV